MNTNQASRPPFRSRLPAAERRAAIVDAAIDLFSRRGFRGTTTRELAAAVGVSEPVLYQHFATKRALWDAILEAKMREVGPRDVAELEAAAASDDDRAFFGKFAALILDWYLNDPRYARLLMYSHLEQHELAQIFFEKQVTVFYDVVTRYIQRQVAGGRFRDIEPTLAARAFAGMLAHAGATFAIYRPGHLLHGRDATIHTMVDIFLNGMYK